MPILARTGFFSAFSDLQVTTAGAVYGDATFHLCLLWTQVWGMKRLSHLNDQPAGEWAMPALIFVSATQAQSAGLLND